MNVAEVETAQATGAADRSWRDLYRAGGLAALLASLMYISALVVLVVTPPAPAAGGEAILRYIAAHRSVYILEQVLWLAPSVLLVVTFLALCAALIGVNRSYAAIGGVLAIASWALPLVYPATGGGAPALVYLSDHYMAAGDAVQRAALAAAAEGFVAQNVIPGAAGILEPIGILIMSLVMLGGVFSRSLAYLGIATGAIGIVSESLRPVLGGGYVVYGLLLLVWLIAVGWGLYRLAGRAATAAP
jgi:hypothetical protein